MKARAARLSPPHIALLRQRYPRAFGRTPGERLRQNLLWTALLVLVLAGMWQTGFFDATRLVRGLSKMAHVLQFMLPPAHHGRLGELLGALLETLAMAFLGTLLASVAAVPLACVGAKNLVPFGVVHFGLRRCLDGLRGVDALIWALMFINVVGLGPFAGILALAMSDTGTLAKLYAEAMENVEQRPIEGIRAAGGNWLQVICFGMFPQVMPVMLSHVLYYFESNTRSATILGVVGAGGIGLQLSDRIRVNNWDEACFILLLILAAVAVIDTISKALRMQLIRSPIGP